MFFNFWVKNARLTPAGVDHNRTAIVRALQKLGIFMLSTNYK